MLGGLGGAWWGWVGRVEVGKGVGARGESVQGRGDGGLVVGWVTTMITMVCGRRRGEGGRRLWRGMMLGR